MYNIIYYYNVVCTRKPRDQTPPVLAAGAPSPAGGGHRHRRRRRKRLLLLFKKAAGQQNAAAAGPQINSRPVITRAPFLRLRRHRSPGRPCKNIMIKTTAATGDDGYFKIIIILYYTRTHTSRHIYYNGPLSSSRHSRVAYNIIIYNARALALINRLAAGAMLDCARTAESSSSRGGHDPLW